MRKIVIIVAALIFACAPEQEDEQLVADPESQQSQLSCKYSIDETDKQGDIRIIKSTGQAVNGSVCAYYESGLPLYTGDELSVMIDGEGFFQVELPDGSIGYTRVGLFSINTDGDVVTQQHGYRLLPNINIPENTMALNISEDAIVSVSLHGEIDNIEIGQIKTARFRNPIGLKKTIEENIYIQTNASGEPEVNIPMQNGFGKLRQYFLETVTALEAEFQYKNGVIEGIARAYYRSGALKSETPYRNDIIDGTKKYYYEGSSWGYYTENPFDIAINGNGFFQVELPDGSIGYTRVGAFKTDTNGNLVTRQHGYRLLPNINIPENAESLNISHDGIASVYLHGEMEETEIGQITTAHFINSTDLKTIGENIYTQTNTLAAPNVNIPGQDDFGELRQHYLEKGSALDAEIPYKNGVREGIARFYYESGAFRGKTSYRNGFVEGIETHYKKDGRLWSLMQYINDEAISGICGDGRQLTNDELLDWNSGDDIYCGSE